MKIDLANPHMGYSLAIAQPRSKDDIWVAPIEEGGFQSLKSLYCSDGEAESDTLPFIVYK
jgi:hypothetical protein